MNIDKPAPESTNIDRRNLTIPDDPDLEDRIRHGLKRGMNRRELFKFTAIAAAVGVPAVRELILSPAKVIVVPPAPAVTTIHAWGPADGWASNSAALAAQFEQVRHRLPTLMEWHTGLLEALMSDVEPHLGDMVRGRNAWEDLGYDPKAPYRRYGRRAGESAVQLAERLETGNARRASRGATFARRARRLQPDSERMVGGLYVPDRVATPVPPGPFVSDAEADEAAADYDDYWDDTPR